MEVFTCKMTQKTKPSFLSNRLQQLKTKAGLIIIMAMALSPSSLLHADALADLIRQKSQAFPPTQAGGAYPVNPAFTQYTHPNFYQNYVSAPNIEAEHIHILYRAEQTATLPSQLVLRTVRQMALDNREIIQGSCWDYLNAAFNRAGVNKNTVFKGEYPYGPFIDTNQIQPGDWLYYVNHSYNDVEHSGLFVGWLNRKSNQALMLSYAGEGRNEPARYKVYDVSHTYNVMRPSY